MEAPSDVQPIGLFDDLSVEDHATAMELAAKNLYDININDIETNLKKDYVRIPNQNYCAVSWVGPTFKAKTTKYGFMILGAFGNLERAKRHALKINKDDPMYDTGIMDTWCFGYPHKSDIIYDANNQFDEVAMCEQRDRLLNEFVVRHKTKLEQDKQVFLMRKRAVQKSKMTKEVKYPDGTLIHHDDNQTIMKGPSVEEIDHVHNEEIKKWIPEIGVGDGDGDGEDYEIKPREINYKLPGQEYAVISYIENTGMN